ncbi:hypothetical protein [Amycolatopsis kentuckyensis]|uniref:hypothetical protein n=1 Tax=Amycolatopsis kentuckyensis TaxID=218823 RepID=UPI001ABF3885|nr:hypothetical protein [Amycolatopsis kentuckyensis]
MAIYAKLLCGFAGKTRLAKVLRADGGAHALAEGTAARAHRVQPGPGHLTPGAEGRRLVLCVDDAHLLEGPRRRAARRRRADRPQTAALSATDGVWRWSGALSAPPRLVELIETRTDRVDADGRRLLELPAFGEQLGCEPLLRLGAGHVEMVSHGGHPVGGAGAGRRRRARRRRGEPAPGSTASA